MSFFSSIPTWGWFDILCNLAVLVALCGESHWALKWLIPNNSLGKTSVKWRREKLKKKFEFLLIVGIAGEVSCLPLSLIESAQLNQEAAEAQVQVKQLGVQIIDTSNVVAHANERIALAVADAAKASERAAVAGKDAAQANERAAKFDADRITISKQAEEIRGTNFLLQARVLELQAKLNPRIITIEQATNFIFLTEKIPKISIGVSIGQLHDETFNFAHQIGHMLEMAGFMRPASHANYLDGIHSDTEKVSYFPFGNNTKWNDFNFLWNTTNSIGDYNFSFEKTNGFSRPIIPENEMGDTNKVFAALIFCFYQIGLTNGFAESKPDMVSPGEFEIFVLQKPQ
jgi:hypothetical protein